MKISKFYEYNLVFFILALHVYFLMWALNQLSISYYEADIFYNKNTFLHYFIRFFTNIFGQNDLVLRLPFIFLNVINTMLIFIISKPFLKSQKERILNLIIFCLIPGLNASALLVNEAGFIIFFSLFFIYLWQKNLKFACIILLFVSLLVDNSFGLLFLTLFFYFAFRKEKFFMAYTFVLFCISYGIFGFETYGKPRGHFLDTIAVYSATLSPLLCVYFIYTLYRMGICENKNILWFISFSAFLLAIVLSFRQRLNLEDFLPFAVISTPLMVRSFSSSYNVRLPKFRKIYKFFFILVLSTLILNFLAIIYNKSLYILYKEPKYHFAYNNHVAKELFNELKMQNIDKIIIEDEKLALRMRFYGVKNEGNLKLTKLKNNETNASKIIQIQYFSNKIARFSINE